MKFMVTGAAGFVGYRLVSELAASGAEVVALDRLYLPALYSMGKAVMPVQMDLVDEHCLPSSAEGCAAIFHLAATRSIPLSLRSPEAVLRNNLLSTLSVLEAARVARVPRVVFASSSSVYGDADQLPTPESAPLKPYSPYSASKAACESMVLSYARSFRLHCTILRLFNVVGARRDADKEFTEAVPRFINVVLSGGSPVIHGDGSQSRDFVHVSDVVRAFTLASTAEPPSGAIYNIGSGAAHSLLEVVGMIAQAVGRPSEPSFESARPGDIRTTCADIAAASRDLGYQPRVSLREAIKLAVMEYRMRGIAE